MTTPQRPAWLRLEAEPWAKGPPRPQRLMLASEKAHTCTQMPLKAKHSPPLKRQPCAEEAGVRLSPNHYHPASRDSPPTHLGCGNSTCPWDAQAWASVTVPGQLCCLSSSPAV